ncbi:MAG: hypothetical protein N3G21_00760 [Candidatus Hydrogenedentes bacterium]|nr:hypothetical protein [Candidatus Hydrogenedentota bacterium]
MKNSKYKNLHIKDITKPERGNEFPFTVDSILKFIQDLIKILIPIFRNKDPETPPVTGGGGGGSGGGSSN